MASAPARTGPMHQREQLQSVVGFYETHPISEYEILEKLRADGIELEGLTEEILQNYDQDHFGGLEAVDVLAEKAGITSGARVLDVCSGMGGPARYLAHRLGCRVTGLDITPSRHESAIRLTRLVGLDQLVDFSLGNALDMPFEDARLRRRDWPGGVRELGEPHFTEITQRERVETAAAQRAARKPSGTGSDGSKEGRLECVFQ